MSNAIELPKGWAKARVDALVQLVNGFAFKPTQWKSEGLPIIRIQNLNNPDAPFNYCPENLPDKIRVRNGDLLFAWSGTPGTSFGAHIWRGEDAWLNQHIFKVLFNREYLDERFLRLAINQNLDSYIRQAHGGAGLAHITKGRFEESELSIAPLNEQYRIVAKIEELFSDLDAGVAALKRAKANLKRYRAAVLKAAVEGKLTDEWRAQHPAKENASTLLVRILKERRQKWEADQLAKFAAAEKEPPKNWREKYVEPSPPNTIGLPELPDGWCWTSIDQIAECLDNQRIPVNKAERANRTGDVPYYGANGLVGYIDDFIFDEPLVLVVEDETFVGREKPFSYLISGKAWVNNHAHILRSTSATTTEFLNYALMFYPFIPMTTGTTARRKLTKQRLMEAPFALPPFDEQVEIVQAIEVRLSNVDYTDASIDASFVRASRLRQSILKQAFEGRLVPQDPRDEPADKLLERIRGEKIAANVSEASNGKPQNSRAKAAK
jgi:type I restriction enzyme S subunit